MTQRRISEGHQAVLDTLARPDLSPEQRVTLAKSVAAVEKAALQLQILRERERNRQKRQKERQETVESYTI